MNRLLPAVALIVAGISMGLLSAGQASAEPTAFDFKDPKGVNGVVFILDSKLEPIVGMGRGIDGEVLYDPADPTSISGSFTLSAEGLQCSSERMTAVMQGADWLGISDHPLVTFTIKSAEAIAQDSTYLQLDVVGDLTLVGITKEITVPIRVEYLPDMAKSRGGAKSGDLLALRAEMTINRTDFGIKPDTSVDVVADEIKIMIPIVGYSQ